MERRLIDTDEVRRLVRAQFPQWAAEEIRPVDAPGWDNQTFRLGEAMSVRLPTAEPYALAVAKEHRWLPALAAALPLPIPVPLGRGVPDESFPHPWSVYRWVDGEPLGKPPYSAAFAAELGAFLTALRAVDTTGGPVTGLHCWHRGGPLTVYDEDTRQAITDLGDRIPAAHATRIWAAALGSAWERPPVWFHGDVAPGNLLLRDGHLAAVIDFGTCGVGDPACDLVPAWTMFTGAAREAFRAATGVDDDTWDRARGWALWKALITYDDPAYDSVRVLGELFRE